MYLFLQYCKADEKEKVRNILDQEDDFVSEGLCCLEQSLDVNMDVHIQNMIDSKKHKITMVSASVDVFKKSKNDFFSLHSEEYLRLLKYQLKLEEKFPSKKFYNLSVQNTLKLLLQGKEFKLSEEMKKEFKVPDKRYCHLKLMTLAEIGEWLEIEKLSKAKKSPIGYEVRTNRDTYMQRHLKHLCTRAFIFYFHFHDSRWCTNPALRRRMHSTPQSVRGEEIFAQSSRGKQSQVLR